MPVRLRRAVMLAVATAIAVTTLAAPARAAAGPYCGITWGSLPKAHAATSTPFLLATRTGQHRCHDRVVIDLEGPLDGYRVEYVDQIRTGFPGFEPPVTGGARLQVTLWARTMDPPTGRWTYPEAPPVTVADVTGYRTLRDVKFAGTVSFTDSDVRSTFGIGVRARLPFRVFVLPGPGPQSRLVIDVAHRW